MFPHIIWKNKRKFEALQFSIFLLRSFKFASGSRLGVQFQNATIHSRTDKIQNLSTSSLPLFLGSAPLGFEHKTWGVWQSSLLGEHLTLVFCLASPIRLSKRCLSFSAFEFPPVEISSGKQPPKPCSPLWVLFSSQIFDP